MAKSSDPRDRIITEEELLASFEAADGAVLVGGQALAFWVAYYDLPLPDGPRTFISGDADFLGMRHHVPLFSAALRARGVPSRQGEVSALHGSVVIDTKDGPKILVDVLRTVVGLRADDVLKGAIAVIHASGVRVRVMNPVDCLVSRFENLRQLRGKRTLVGAWQAEIGIQVCRAYIERLITDSKEGEARDAATRVLRLAGLAAGLQAYRNYNLEPLDAIPVEHFAPMFQTKQYAYSRKKIEQLREAYRAPPPRNKDGGP